MTQTVETVTSDVLVIGGGIGGLTAAIKARGHDADVLVVDKGGIGWAGQVPISGGRSMVILPEESVDNWVKWAVENGEYLNDQDWTRRFGEKVHECTMDLAGWGMPFFKQANQLNIIPRMKAYKAVQFPAKKLMPKMWSHARKKGVRMMDKVAIVDLISKDGAVTGALGLGLTDNRFYLFRAKAFIIANGSCRYKRQKGFNMCNGEGVVMAYRAGARLRNAEFSNTYGYCSVGYEVFTRNPIYYFFVNSKGENILLKHFPDMREAMETKREKQDYSKITEAMAREVFAGNGPIYLDLTRSTPEELDFARGTHLAKDGSVISGFWDTLPAKGIHPDREKVEMMPMFVGGQGPIRVDLECRTNVSRLWAIGDASALGCGWSGARSPGTVPAVGIPFAFVSGSLAGTSAGVFVKDAPETAVDMREVTARKEEILSPLKRGKGPNHRDLICQIHEAVVPLNYNFFRKKDRLKEAIGMLEKAREDVGHGVAKDFHQLVKLAEAEAMAVSGEITFRAALMRQESRGTHMREDFQDQDNVDWLKWIIVEQQDDRMHLFTEPVPMDKYKYNIK
ncbi:MAG: FAD-binding protein [Desulfobacterales bacterium]|nr:FAD-binding protein [Desulfobacterales bacterium]